MRFSSFDYLRKKDVHTIIVSSCKVVAWEASSTLVRLFDHDIQAITAPLLTGCVDDGLIKDIQKEDWLRREPVQIDLTDMASHIKDEK